MSDIVEQAKAAYARRWGQPGGVYPASVPSGVVELGDWASEHLPELVAEVERLRGCPHDSWSGDGTGRWRCDECGADQGSQDVGEVRRQLAESQADVERLRHELSDAAARIRAFAKDNVHHGDMTPMAQRQWNVLADTIASARSGVGVQEAHQ